MPTVIKSSSNVADLGVLSTYSVSNAAIPHDTTDTSGAVPTVNVTLAEGVETDYLIGETLTISNPAIDTYSGEIVEVSGSSNSGRYTLNSETIISRVNSEQRLYPSQPYGNSTAVPLAALDYWSQQCGIFYDAAPGDVLFYQSQHLHWFAYAKSITKPVRGNNVSAAGGTEITFATRGTRYVTTFGKNRDLSVPFPTSQKMTVQVPRAGDPRFLVFSTGILNQGTGRRATYLWNFETPTKKKVVLKLIVENSVGVTAQLQNVGASFVNVASVPGLANGDYRISLGVTTYSNALSTINLNIIDGSGTIVASTSNKHTSDFRGSLSLTSIIYRGEDQGSGSDMMHWGDYISIMDAMPTTRPVDQKSFAAGPKAAEFFTGFSGNVWENIKAYCSIYHLDVSNTGGKLTVAPRQTATTTITKLGTLTKRSAKRDKARFVEVVNLNSKPTYSGGYVTPKVMWKADSVYQVAVGETQEIVVQTDHSILALSQPVCVTGISPYPYTAGAGQYVVTGADGYIVSPSFWADQGGSVTVDTTENEGEIKITIKGPDYDSIRAPYRISEGDAGRPALYVTGEGAINTKKTLRVGTGNSKAAKEVGVTLESPFLTNTTLAYDAAARAARKFATADISVTYAEALDYDSPSDLGSVPVGQLVKRDGNILRLTDSTQTPAALSGTAVQHNTIKQVKDSFGTGTTIKQAKDFYAGKTIAQVNLKPLKVVK